MKAIVYDHPGDESVLKLGEAPDPKPGPDQLLIKVITAGINRADLMQREGRYPPPPGASDILGLECAGEVAEVGANVKGWHPGDRAMCLIPGGGYAGLAAVHFGSAIQIPKTLSDEEAGGIPEVYLTAFLNLFLIGELTKGGVALVHGGGSGVGTAAIQMLKEFGARSIVTAGSDEKCDQCLKFGADVAINYNSGPFMPKVKEATGGRGVDVVLDIVGIPYLEQNLDSLVRGGRLILVSLMKGARGEVDLSKVQRNHLRIIGSTLRSRPVEEKAAIVSNFLRQFGAALEAGRIRPPIYRTVPLAEAAQAHRMMQRSEHFGKIILRVA
ncbi:MAG: NAD(P)H-quinone oxidoreductase [Candidatus Binataceae bacterium]|nr:NAD(P)H-quinone oxidoreductase [Candidatus Binataceae bacterium]